jgi:hypothetical protein
LLKIRIDEFPANEKRYLRFSTELDFYNTKILFVPKYGQNKNSLVQSLKLHKWSGRNIRTVPQTVQRVSPIQVRLRKGDVIRVTGRAGPLSCETSRLPDILDNLPVDGGDVVGLTLRPPFTTQEDSWY